jgi:tRNA-2-methylthio-N6-dimethylallyladenosine synthase
MGRTRTNRLTFFAAAGANAVEPRPGDLVPVRIESVRAFSLSGQAVITPSPMASARKGVTPASATRQR